jgi:predicted nucleic acid-binding protein
MNLIKAKDLPTFLKTSYAHSSGCLIDTNILLAANFNLDHFYDVANDILDDLARFKVPRFANVNIRAEFINLSRRVVIAQALLDLFHKEGTGLPIEVYNKLRSIKTRSSVKEKENKLLRLQDKEIEEIRILFSNFHPSPQKDLWDWFCDDYLVGKISSEWAWVEKDFGINFLSLRGEQSLEHLEEDLHWDDAVAIIEKTGIGSADAMIVNLLLKSKYSFIVTADSDIVFAMQRLSPPNKFVVAP